MYTVSKIATIVHGNLQANFDKNYLIKDLLYDSRKIQGTQYALFFALVTAKNDGHKYIDSLYKRNVYNFVVNKDFDRMQDYPKANFILVDNTLLALHQLTKFHRKKFSIPVIGITGSNGKTIIKEWLYQLLCPDNKIVYSPNSFNSQIGVPLSVWKMSKDDQLGIFEAGISKPDEMNTLKKFIEPTIGIFTNIGSAHDEAFMDIRQKVGEKLNLFRNVDTLIVSSDHGLIMEGLMRTELLKKIRLFSWSTRGKDADLIINTIEKRSIETFIQALYKEKEISITIPFVDDAAIENVIHCWATMLLMDYSNEIIIERIAKLTPIAMRLEMKQGINRCMIINDTYNSDINSLQIALDLMNNQHQYQKRTVILSDILQSRSSENTLYREIALLLENKNIHRIIGIGEAIGRQNNSFTIEKEFYKTTNDFFSNFDTNKLDNEIVLVKGARQFNFERISNYLSLKTHETVMEVSLPALIDNLNYYRTLLKPTTKIMVMVKAFGYGMGDIDIANALQFYGVNYLAVAYADEGVSLRNKNITLPVMVMNPDELGLELILKYELQPEIYSFRILHLLLSAMEQNFHRENVNIHLKIDTGMHRLGFEKKDISELVQILKNNPNIRVESIFSHFAAADDPQENDFTKHQADLFSECYQSIAEQIGYYPLKHISNSAAMSRFPEYQFDMVRMGIGLYGINPFVPTNKLSNVATLRTIISQIKYITASDTVGYNRKWKANKDTVLATVPIGYADGFPRSAGNGNTKVLINGKLANVVGNVCMDMCMVDITNIPAKEGDTVIIFGKELSISQLARSSSIIEYELLTGISQRVKRIFIHD
ncbi:MAG: bifunctional UDP-N-acetylmuramoyl-tripeptide:D-alanyl-D-alanine ligase/alanine racemase [Bacteroidales bacterium]|jgi:alanine racemase|nr:bifunctional UDP-N-acetylmuramoyl-tripeptide:D-alanyl-D-alanine ligase/alanine racemase [Bacteroidales bacterium]